MSSFPEHLPTYLELLDEKSRCTPMFIAALFIIAKIWKKLKCSSADEWIKILWYIYMVEYYWAIKKENKTRKLTVVAAWMDLESIMLSEISQRKTSTILFHSYVEYNEQNNE